MTKQNNLTPIHMTMPRIAHANAGTQERRSAPFQLDEAGNVASLHPAPPPCHCQKADPWPLPFTDRYNISVNSVRAAGVATASAP